METTGEKATRDTGTPSTTLGPRMSRNRLSVQVAERIKDQVIADGLKPGDRLPTEPELMKRFDVGRSVIREAGRVLDERGLVDIRPGRGMTVAEFDGASLSRQYGLMLELNQGSFQQLMEVRLVLEVGMTALAAENHAIEDGVRIQVALDAFSEAGGDHQRALEWDLKFHEAVAMASGNVFFVNLVNPINQNLRKVYQSSMGYEAAQHQTLDEHRAIAKAVLEGDGAKARDASFRHLTRIAATAHKLVANKDDAVINGA